MESVCSGLADADAMLKRADENRIGRVLRHLGFESVRKRVNGVRASRWYRELPLV